MSADPRAVPARQFCAQVLNILLKFARLYEFGHVRTAGAVFETTWKEFCVPRSTRGGESGLFAGRVRRTDLA